MSLSEIENGGEVMHLVVIYYGCPVKLYCGQKTLFILPVL